MTSWCLIIQRIRFLTWLMLLLTVCSAQGVEVIRLEAAELRGLDWQVQGVQWVLNNPGSDSQALELQVAHWQLPKPLDGLHMTNIRCAVFQWQKQQLACQKGSGLVQWGKGQAVTLSIGFVITAQQVELHLHDLPIAEGSVNVDATEGEGIWQLQFTVKNVALAKVQLVLQLPSLEIKQGKMNAALRLDGQQRKLVAAALNAHSDGLTAHTVDNHYAFEKAGLDVYLTAQPTAGTWAWQSHSALLAGDVYVDPVYVAVSSTPVELDAVGSWLPDKQQWQVDYAQYIHPKLGTLMGSANGQLAVKPYVKSLQLSVDALDLKPLNTIYNAPFWVGSALEAVELSGQLQGKLRYADAHWTAVQLAVQHFGVRDPKQRFALDGMKGSFSWDKQRQVAETSELQWDRLQVYDLPFGPAKLAFGINAAQVNLLKPVQVDFLGGIFAIEQFAWQARAAQTPEVHFSGGLHDVSLEQLTTALKWTPLTGTLNGDIPGITYQRNRVDLDGALQIKAFAGDVRIQKLALADIWSEVPKLYSDVAFTNLSLQQLTGQLKFGGIEGLLSGFVNDLYLENGHPISFYAWMGTPEDDQTAHRISQKAVDNIAQIGGNRATDAISRSVLGVFDSFGYQQLGLGCYLHDGVCQLMGVAATKNGYTMVQGGGLPRIDVIGYNPRVDWSVLVQRLARITHPNDMVVE